MESHNTGRACGIEQKRKKSMDAWDASLLRTQNPNTDARRTAQIDAKGESTHFDVTSAHCSPHQLEALGCQEG